MDAITHFDYTILNFIQDHLRSPFTDGFFSLITHLGDGGIFWMAFAAFLLIFPKTRKTGLTLGLAYCFGAIFINLVLKPLVARIRPYENAAFADLIRLTRDQLLIRPPKDFSFPSGHTLVSFEAASVLLLRHRRWGIPALAAAVLIAFSRMYLYVHYFTDVAAAMLLGIGFGFAAFYLTDAAEKMLRARRAGKAG